MATMTAMAAMALSICIQISKIKTMYIGINAQNLKKWLRTYNNTLTLWELQSELKICIFLLYAHVTPIFGLRWTQLNGIITCPHHEVTLDNFGFLVGAHSTAWWAVIRPYMAKMVLLGAKNAVVLAKSQFLMPSWWDTKKTTFLCWLRRTAGLGAAAGAHFWPENVHFFTLRPYNPHFLGSDGPESMRS